MEEGMFITLEEFEHLLYIKAEEQNKNIVEVCDEIIFRYIDESNIDAFGDKYLEQLFSKGDQKAISEFTCFSLTMVVKANALNRQADDVMYETMELYKKKRVIQ